MVTTYRGWRIFYDGSAPVTGRWRATRFGVGMCAGSEALLRRMIDQRVENDAPGLRRVVR